MRKGGSKSARRAILMAVWLVALPLLIVLFILHIVGLASEGAMTGTHLWLLNGAILGWAVLGVWIFMTSKTNPKKSSDHG